MFMHLYILTINTETLIGMGGVYLRECRGSGLGFEIICWIRECSGAPWSDHTRASGKQIWECRRQAPRVVNRLWKMKQDESRAHCDSPEDRQWEAKLEGWQAEEALWKERQQALAHNTKGKATEKDESRRIPVFCAWPTKHGRPSCGNVELQRSCWTGGESVCGHVGTTLRYPCAAGTLSLGPGFRREVEAAHIWV